MTSRRHPRRQPKGAPGPQRENRHPEPLHPSTSVRLAGQLLRELTPCAGDREEVNAVLMRWFEVHDVRNLGLVCMAAMQTTFAECLTPTPVEDVPPGALTFSTKETPL